ncbi:MAG: decarboxylating NADP(+)-dependent phosphogluconate dehydrogenase [Acidimicrobiia bacterium]|nr:decarboxylating NADP(+)-dependent phosphogluconate dehydrogenase [Acidimicrobiia bacterium]
MKEKMQIGLVGLAVMGQNLVLNLVDHGYRVAVHNRTTATTRRFLAERAGGLPVKGADTLEDLVKMLEPPRRILLMVKAGAPVDSFIDRLLPLLSAGDVLADLGNSFYLDTARRLSRTEAEGIHYLGVGVSGGEEGARWGPSIMAGGGVQAWDLLREPLTAISAKRPDGTPCCDRLGPEGAGHFVKMVHNGIEYGDMQLLAEAYHLLKSTGMTHGEMSELFHEWRKGPLDSYLVDITAEILSRRDDDGHPLLPKVLDLASQKGTGRDTVKVALDLGQPMTLVAEAVMARAVSALKAERTAASRVLEGPGEPRLTGDRVRLAGWVHDALHASKIISYAQGFMVLRSAGEEFGWDLDLARVAEVWREGCIIRARLLEEVIDAFRSDEPPANLLLHDHFKRAVGAASEGWRLIVAKAALAGIPVPGCSAALAFYDGYRSERLPANLVAAQRDYFGAHTYHRTDRPLTEFFHTDWSFHETAEPTR